MGQEIETSRFSDADFRRFAVRLREETEILGGWFHERLFSAGRRVGGFEMEAWLVDPGCRPAPHNAELLERLDSPLVVPELAAFNVELNSSPLRLEGDALSRMQRELEATVRQTNGIAADLDAELLMVGILPTVEVGHLNLAHMSDMRRYRALNDQVLRRREGRPIDLNIVGRDALHYQHGDVMLEAAATSFQIHYKADQDEGLEAYNASKVLSAPLLAVSANSPYLFGRELWEETRIPLFEQSVSVGGSDCSHRVTFGSSYARDSLMECFTANLERYPVLLPMNVAGEAEDLQHLRLHNGTIWRWNRPLIGFDDDGTPHLRIEHRVMPAGPSLVDSIANAALYFGLVHRLARDPRPAAQIIPFSVARDNFYSAARHGLQARLEWRQGRRMKADELLLEELLPLAYEGLEALGVSAEDRRRYLGIIAARLESGQNGAAWQRAWVAAHGKDMAGLCGAYRQHQRSGAPVHEWSL